MSQQTKAAYFQALKKAGVTFERHYREYTTEELKASHDELVVQGIAEPLQEALEAEEGLFPPLDPDEPAEAKEEPQQAQAAPQPQQAQAAPQPQQVPHAQRDPNELAGQRQNTKPHDEPLRIDDEGLIWYQEEVRKASYAKPRGRRVLKYNDPGIKKQTAQSGEYTETFEVGGDARVPSEVKITLPSYQVGIYKDRRFPFKIHVYNGNRGFDLFEVQDYYGGAEMVPHDIKRIYVENVLCYDIRTTVRAIQTAYRQLQLAGKVK